MAIFNFDQTACLLNGSAISIPDPYAEPDKNGWKPQVLTTWKNLIVDALSAVTEKDKNMSGSQRLERARFIEKIFDGGDLDLGESDKTTILDAVGAAFSNQQIFIQINRILEGKQPRGTEKLHEQNGKIAHNRLAMME